MAQSRKQLVNTILDEYGFTFSHELGFHPERNTPSPLFRLLVFAILSSTRISHNLALQAARALAGQGWNTPGRMAEATWRQRTDVLNHCGYARYDESTSRMLEDSSRILLDRYKGDLRRLREQSNRDPDQQRKLLKEFKGIGEVGVDIFFREAQAAWPELLPFADKRALDAAGKLNLGSSAAELRRLVSDEDFPRFVAGLVRVSFDKAWKGLAE